MNLGSSDHGQPVVQAFRRRRKRVRAQSPDSKAAFFSRIESFAASKAQAERYIKLEQRLDLRGWPC